MLNAPYLRFYFFGLQLGNKSQVWVFKGQKRQQLATEIILAAASVRDNRS